MNRVMRLESLLRDVRSCFRDDGAAQVVKQGLVDQIDAALADTEEWPNEIRQSDTQTIIAHLMRDCRYHLFSQLEEDAGRPIRVVFDDMVRSGLIEACFPEAKRGDSGRQFWRWRHVQALQNGAEGNRPESTS